MMPIGSKWIPWTPDEDAQLWALVRRVQATGGKFDWPAIAAQMPGRSATSCKQHYLLLRRKDRGKPERERRTNSQILADAKERMQEAIPPHAIPRHASLTAAICGDPLPGRSALDQKREGVRL